MITSEAKSLFIWQVFFGIASITYLTSMIAERAVNQWVVQMEIIENRVDRYEKKAQLKKLYTDDVNNVSLPYEDQHIPSLDPPRGFVHLKLPYGVEENEEVLSNSYKAHILSNSKDQTDSNQNSIRLWDNEQISTNIFNVFKNKE